MRTITVEEHYATAAFMDGPGRQLAALADSVREHPQVAAGFELLIKQLVILATAGSRPWTLRELMFRSCR